MYLHKNKWPDTDNAHRILFFAQVSFESLFIYSWDPFKSPTLTTLSRLREAISTIEYIKNSKQSEKILNPIIEEIIWSIEYDNILNHILGDRRLHIKNTISKKGSIDDKYDIIHYTFLLLRNKYKSYSENLLLEELFNKKFKKSIVFEMARNYVSHLTNLGYSRKYIFKCIENDFFKRDVVRADRRRIDKFFDNFPDKLFSYDIYFKDKKSNAQYLKNTIGVEIQKDDGFAPKSIYEKYPRFALNKKSETYFHVRIKKMRDIYSATNRANELISISNSIYFLSRLKTRSDPIYAQYVVKERKHIGELVRPAPSPLEQRPRWKDWAAVGSPKSIIDNISKRDMDRDSRHRLINTIMTASSVSKSNNIDHQFISLWSAIEYLLSNPRDTSRIEHYVKYITPLISRGYIYRHFNIIFDGLNSNYKEDICTLLNSYDNNKNNSLLFKFIHLIIHGDNNNISKIFNIVSKNPILLYRINDIFNFTRTNKDIGKKLSNHEKKVIWQIHRIYRIRNYIVHGGPSDKLSELILLNLHDYIISMISTINDTLSSNDHITTIDGAVTHSILMRYTIQKTIDQNSKCGNISDELFNFIIRKDL